MALPLAGLEAFVRRAGRPEDELAVARGRTPYHLSERQAKAILEMRLSRLTGLEQDKLAAEYGELCTTIARLKAILASPKLLDDVIVMELEEIKSKYADKRRTEIVESEADTSGVISWLTETAAYRSPPAHSSPRCTRGDDRNVKSWLGSNTSGFCLPFAPMARAPMVWR